MGTASAAAEALVDAVVSSARRIYSYWDMKDKLKQWIVSREWKDSSWSKEADCDYTYDCLISRSWWEDLKMMAARYELQSLFQEGSEDLKNFMGVVDKGVADLYSVTLMIAGGVLDPETHYKCNLASNIDYMQAFMMAIQKVADSPASAAEALHQLVMLRSSRGRFDTEMARLGASKMSPSWWWQVYGGEVRTLQKYAIQIVFQCMSPSGCERNWSTFAVRHARARNRLVYEKLHKLVYVRYNLQLRMARKRKSLIPAA